MFISSHNFQPSLDSIVDSSSAFQAGDPGSIPRRSYFLLRMRITNLLIRTCTWKFPQHSSQNWKKKLFSWKNNCPNCQYYSRTMKIQIIKNYWDMEIIGNRRKMTYLKFQFSTSSSICIGRFITIVISQAFCIAHVGT